MKLIDRMKKTVIAAAFAAAAWSMTVFAAEDMPFEIALDMDTCERLSYAGHTESGIKYKTAYAITPESSFRLERARGSESGVTAEDVEIKITLLYENDDNSGTLRETVKTYEKGDLSDDGTYYSFLSENTKDSLAERDKLYSDSLCGMEMKLSYEKRGSKSEKLYFYVCTEDDFYSYLDSSTEDGTYVSMAGDDALVL